VRREWAAGLLECEANPQPQLGKTLVRAFCGSLESHGVLHNQSMLFGEPFKSLCATEPPGRTAMIPGVWRRRTGQDPAPLLEFGRVYALSPLRSTAGPK